MVKLYQALLVYTAICTDKFALMKNIYHYQFRMRQTFWRLMGWLCFFLCCCKSVVKVCLALITIHECVLGVVFWYLNMHLL